MTHGDYIDLLLEENFNLKNGDPIPWYVLASAFVAGKATDFVIDRFRKIISLVVGNEISKEGVGLLIDMEDELLEEYIAERKKQCNAS